MPSMEVQECPVLEVQRGHTHRQTFSQTIYSNPPKRGRVKNSSVLSPYPRYTTQVHVPCPRYTTQVHVHVPCPVETDTEN